MELGSQNPSQKDLVQFLFNRHNAMEVVLSIARNGFFSNEPLVGVWEGDQIVVVEGNRRLAALKALRKPTLLEGAHRRQVERIVRDHPDAGEILRVPVVVAPDRRAADPLLTARHTQNLLEPWAEANRSRFIIAKLDEGYTTEELRTKLGFTPGDVKDARFFRSMVDVARSLDLDEERAIKFAAGDASFTTLERILKSAPARRQLHIEPDDQHGFKVKAEPAAFKRAMKRIVEDLIDEKVNSRKVNDVEGMEAYVMGLGDALPARTAAITTASELLPVPSAPVSNTPAGAPREHPKRAKKAGTTAVPKAFKPLHGSQKVLAVHTELTGLDRDKKPYASAVLLRVYLELSIVDYLRRTKKFEPLLAALKSEEVRLEQGIPKMKDLVKAILKEAKQNLDASEYGAVEKALTPNDTARFNVSELHAFVHGRDLPIGQDLLQFWVRTEPLFRMMLQ
jgi:hypothetical protein